MLISTRRSLLLAATLAVVAVVPIWQAAAEIVRQIDDTSNNSTSHININIDDETHHENTRSSGGIRGLRNNKKKKNSMSRSKSHKAAKRPKAKGKKKNVFDNKDTTTEEDDTDAEDNKGGDEDESVTGTFGNPCVCCVCPLCCVPFGVCCE
eukprot:314989_1